MLRTLVQRGTLAALAAIAALSLIPALATAAEPVRLTELSSLVIVGNEGQPIHIVSGTLPAGTKLPATIELPVPKGATTPSWAGEILGGDPSKDPSATPKIVERDGVSIATLTLKTARIGQIEFELPSQGTSETKTLTSSLFVPAGVDVARAGVRVPTGAKTGTIPEGAEKREGPGGLEYSKTVKNAKAGSTVEIAVDYIAAAGSLANPNKVAADSAPAPASTAGSNNIALWIILGVAAVLAFLLVRSVNAKMQAKAQGAPSQAAPAKATARSEGGTAKASPKTSSSKAPKSEPAARRISPALVIIGIVVVLVVGGVAATYKPAVKVQAGTTVENGVQKIAVDTSSGDFEPGEFRAKAGMPIQLQFGSGTGCTSKIAFTTLGIDRDLTQGATIDIQALEPGTYPYNCGSGSQSGALVVE